MNISWIVISSSLFINYLFNSQLKKRFNNYRFLEIGYILNISLSFYILGPALLQLTSSYVEGDPISYIFSGFTNTNENDYNRNLIRSLVFQLFFCFSYFFFREKKYQWKLSKYRVPFDNISTFILTIFLILSYFTLFSLSQGYDDYYESYLQYEHLSGPIRLVISILIRFKYAIIILLLINVFSIFWKKKSVLLIYSIIILLVEGVYSAGARITILFILMQIFFLYSVQYGISKLNLKKTLLVLLPILVLFTTIEKVRTNQVDENNTESLIAIPGELGAIFFPSIHLYEVRRKGNLPDKNIKMLFYDFIGTYQTSSSIEEFSPMHWYQSNYFPNSKIPPFTVGPLANTAIWEGEIGIPLRSIILGIILAIFTNNILKRGLNTLKLLTYVFVFSTSIMIMKYSIFYHITPIVKTVIPVYAAWKIYYNILNFYSR